MNIDIPSIVKHICRKSTIDHFRNTSTRPEDRHQVCLAQTILFHQKLERPIGRAIWYREDPIAANNRFNEDWGNIASAADLYGCP